MAEKIIKTFGEWRVMNWGLSHDRAAYDIEKARIIQDGQEWIAHMETKRWVVMADFLEAIVFFCECERITLKPSSYTNKPDQWTEIRPREFVYNALPDRGKGAQA